MANLTPAGTNDNVVQIETTDLVLGGPGAILNQQAQALLNRLEYTRERMLTPWTGTGIVFTSTGSNLWDNKYTSAGGHNKVHYRKDASQVWLTGAVTNTSMSTPVSSDIMTLPVAARPANDTVVWAYAQSGTTTGMVKLVIGASGNVTCAAPIDGDLYLDGVSYKIGADAY